MNLLQLLLKQDKDSDRYAQIPERWSYTNIVRASTRYDKGSQSK